MRINENLIEKLLSEQGFCLVCVDYRAGHLRFSKPQKDNESLFEVVDITLAGHEKNFISGAIGISCIRGRFSWQGLFEKECLVEIAADKKRGYTCLSSNYDSNLWVEQFCKILPDRFIQTKQKFYSLVDQRTLPARSACEHYLKTMGFPCLASAARERLSAKSSEEQMRNLNQIMSQPVGWLAQPVFHFVAAMAVCSLSSELEPTIKFNFIDPSNDIQLMWRIQIIADRLMSYPKPITIVFPDKPGLEYFVRKPICS